MARPALITPPKPVPGTRVAIVSPSFAAPAHYPAVHELAMRRLRDELRVEPVEYPTTRQLHASPEARAADLVAAFTDPEIGAILATIGGDDQITVLPHLDARAIAANPKPYVGYSDNTNLLNWLWNLGIVGYHGGSTMVHLGRGGSTHPVSIGSLRSALFTTDEVDITPVDRFGEDSMDWADPAALEAEPPMRRSEGWIWHRPGTVIEGPIWGGNLEVLHWNLAAGRWIRPAEDYDGCLLLLETSEEMPSATEVFRMLRNLGERGILTRVAALVMGRPKASHFGTARTDTERAAYVRDQREAVLAALERYHPSLMTVFGVDIGHTDPQWVVPYGGWMRIDGPTRSIRVRY